MAKSEISNTIPLDIYFDFLCPYVYRASIWLQRVKEDIGSNLTITWKYFSLEQVSAQDPQWKIWKQPKDYPSRGLCAFQAAEAARQQGETIFASFHSTLLRARHEQHKDIADIGILTEVAKSVGLEMDRFQKDISNRKLLTKLGEDHTFAVETLGIFGTPTLVFPERQPIFLKLSSPPPPEESLSVFTELHNLVEQRRYIQEIKRPQPPNTR
ncbi:DsbA family protein [Chloroflexota bacterium]